MISPIYPKGEVWLPIDFRPSAIKEFPRRPTKQFMYFKVPLRFTLMSRNLDEKNKLRNVL